MVIYSFYFDIFTRYINKRTHFFRFSSAIVNLSNLSQFHSNWKIPSVKYEARFLSAIAFNETTFFSFRKYVRSECFFNGPNKNQNWGYYAKCVTTLPTCVFPTESSVETCLWVNPSVSLDR